MSNIRKLSLKLLNQEWFDSSGNLIKDKIHKITIPEFKIFNSKFAGKPDDKFETMLFLPEGDGRQGEGGLRTKGYFKFSYKLMGDGLWYTCDLDGNPVKPAPEDVQESIKDYLKSLKERNPEIDLDTIKELPLITVITVVLNGEKYLEETIQSVINQTYPNVEYVIIDGGSTDKTVSIINKYENYIDYWVSEKDKGIYDAMNKGIYLSFGKGRLFLNAGDKFVGDILYPYLEIPSFLTVKYKRFGKLVTLKPKPIQKGLPYCHQGILFDRDNTFLYNTMYKYAADYEYFIKKYKWKLNKFTLYSFNDSSFVYYDNNGLSARNPIDRDKEIFMIIKENFGFIPAFKFIINSCLKILVKHFVGIIKA